MNPNLTELDFIQECYIRGLYQCNPNMAQKYRNFLTGYQGEKIMYDWLIRNLPPEANILHDFWIKYRGTTQIDLLVIINNIIWIIEVKHYNGFFQYMDNICTLNGHRLDKDYIAQMRNRMLIMKDVIKQSGQVYQLKGTVIFTHENSEISIPSESTFKTLTLNQVKRYLVDEILSKTQHKELAILPHLKKFETSSTFTMPVLDKSDDSFLKKGVYCPKCYSFNLRTNDRMIACENCYYKESKRVSILRQYCCLGVLQHQNPYITSKEIYELSIDYFSPSYIRKLLKRNLQHKLQGKRLSFYNHALPYEKYIKKVSKYKN